MSASCPAWPKGVWPRSCASEIASVSASLRRRARATERAIWGDFNRVGDARAVEVAFVIDENLGFVDEAAEGVRMDDAIAIALKLTPIFRLRLWIAPSPRLLVVCSVRRQRFAAWRTHWPACYGVIHASVQNIRVASGPVPPRNTPR